MKTMRIHTPPANSTSTIRSSLLLLLMLASSLALPAQTRLQEYLEIAAENNPTLKARFSEYQSALEQGPQMRALPDPELSFSVFLMPMERYMGEQLGDISIMQMFPWFGSLKAGEEEAALMAKMSFERFLEAKLDLFYSVRTSWYDLYEREQELRLLQEELALLQSLERLALSVYSSGQSGAAGSRTPSPARNGSGERQEQSGGGGMGGMGMGGGTGGSGSASPSGGAGPAMSSMGSTGGGMVDVLLVQLQIRALENRIQLLERSKKPLTTAFNKLLNRPAAAAIQISDSLQPADPPAALAMAPEEVVARHPMIRMWEWDEQARQAQLRMATLMGRPMFGLGLNYMLFRPREVGAMEMGPMENGKNMLMPMATLSLPIYRKKNNAQQRQARYLQEAAVQQRAAAENELLSELEQLLYDYEASTSRLALIRDQLEITEQALRLLTTNYSVGNISMETLIQQRQNLLAYKQEQLREITNQHKAVAAINRLMTIDI
jgi:outer membrane protein TolC